LRRRPLKGFGPEEVGPEDPVTAERVTGSATSDSQELQARKGRPPQGG
jgi:hypothetical protein